MRWPEAAADHSNIRAGLRMALLNQALRDTAEVDQALSEQEEVKLHFMKHISTEAGVARAISHVCSCRHEDKYQGFCALEDPSKGDTHTSSIKMIQKKGDKVGCV